MVHHNHQPVFHKGMHISKQSTMCQLAATQEVGRSLGKDVDSVGYSHIQ